MLLRCLVSGETNYRLPQVRGQAVITNEHDALRTIAFMKWDLRQDKYQPILESDADEILKGELSGEVRAKLEIIKTIYTEENR